VWTDEELDALGEEYQRVKYFSWVPVWSRFINNSCRGGELAWVDLKVTVTGFAPDPFSQPDAKWAHPTFEQYLECKRVEQQNRLRALPI
jgi:hypothetical protein